jgi:hypothetical protein
MRRNWLISRRTALKGLGISLALPLLETMGWAETPKGQSAYKPPVRLGFMYMAMGVHENMFWPKEAKAWPLVLPPTLEPLRPVIDQCLLLDGIENIGAGPLNASHELELSTWLTATRPGSRCRGMRWSSPPATWIPMSSGGGTHVPAGIGQRGRGSGVVIAILVRRFADACLPVDADDGFERLGRRSIPLSLIHI